MHVNTNEPENPGNIGKKVLVNAAKKRLQPNRNENALGASLQDVQNSGYERVRRY
jgi:hypothetical protein